MRGDYPWNVMVYWLLVSVLRKIPQYRGFSWWPCWRAETMKQFCMKIDLISQGRENVLFLPSNMAAMTSHENALFNTYV